MKTALLRDALPRALLVSLAIPALAELAACGGNVILDQQGSSGAGGAGGSGGSSSAIVGVGGGSSVVVGVGGGVPVGTGAGGGTTESCSLISTTPIDVTNGGCQEDFGLAGPASICAPGPGGTLDTAECAMLCPPNSDGQSALSCTAQDLSVPPDSGVLTCFYGPCGTGG